VSTDLEIGGYGNGDDAEWPPNVYGPVCSTAPFSDRYGEVALPHQCDGWTIGYGPRETVLARIDQLIADLHAAKSNVLNWER
jgi:hypothetical protein